MPVVLESSFGTSDVLRSWKEIAAYLHCAVRTAQRWEAELGLPVHRLRTRHRDAVFSRCHELDEWLQRSFSGKPTTPIAGAWPAATVLDRAFIDLANDLQLLRRRLAARAYSGDLPGTARLIQTVRAQMSGLIQRIDKNIDDQMLPNAASPFSGPGETPAHSVRSYGYPGDPQATPVPFVFLALEFCFLLVQKANSGRKELAAGRIRQAWKAYANVLKFRDSADLDETAITRVDAALEQLRTTLENSSPPLLGILPESQTLDQTRSN